MYVWDTNKLDDKVFAYLEENYLLFKKEIDVVVSMYKANKNEISNKILEKICAKINALENNLLKSSNLEKITG